MLNKGIITQIFSFILYVLVQVLLLKNIVLFDKSFCFLYIAFLLLIPVEAKVLGLMIVGFITGIAVDIFYDSLGIHAAASVFIMFVRNYWLNMLTPQGGYDSGTVPTISSNGLRWFTSYVLPLIFLHHCVLFLLESWGFGLLGFTLTKAFFSTWFTFIVMLITQYLFYNKKRSL
ncbi:Rod shape-determining protein MreD [Fulvivirga maritima]|uniref:Rod shape-determining protein MreD n=1 Tax=Fulvivirga maritima TaxID=2904247 RepID=UPI001F17066C|nr:Rod shape-determining protein MreD [Fulvivirga maritima]UII28835.1 Rod shape-determining protein MreD [Fulvivirga maritima]